MKLVLEFLFSDKFCTSRFSPNAQAVSWFVMESLYAGDTIWELCGVEILEWNFEEDIPIIKYYLEPYLCNLGSSRLVNHLLVNSMLALQLVVVLLILDFPLAFMNNCCNSGTIIFRP